MPQHRGLEVPALLAGETVYRCHRDLSKMGHHHRIILQGEQAQQFITPSARYSRNCISTFILRSEPDGTVDLAIGNVDVPNIFDRLGMNDIFLETNVAIGNPPRRVLLVPRNLEQLANLVLLFLEQLR